MPKATLRDIAIRGKRLFVRVDFNVPLSKAGEVTDKTAALYRYTIKVTEQKKLASIILPNAPAVKIAAITLEK